MLIFNETKTDRAYRLIKQMIISGEINASSLMSEHALAKKLEVSRTPVREAMLRLSNEGFVRSYSRRGTLLKEISITEVNDLFDLRLAIEEFLLSRVAPLLSVQHWQQINLYMQQMAKACADMDLPQYLAIDIKFHNFFAMVYGSKSLQNSLKKTQEQFTVFGLKIIRDKTHVEESMHGHREIVAALKAGNSEAARIAIRNHIEFGRSQVMSIPRNTSAPDHFQLSGNGDTAR